MATDHTLPNLSPEELNKGEQMLLNFVKLTFPEDWDQLNVVAIESAKAEREYQQFKGPTSKAMTTFDADIDVANALMSDDNADADKAAEAVLKVERTSELIQKERVAFTRSIKLDRQYETRIAELCTAAIQHDEFMEVLKTSKLNEASDFKVVFDLMVSAVKTELAPTMVAVLSSGKAKPLSGKWVDSTKGGTSKGAPTPKR